MMQSQGLGRLQTLVMQLLKCRNCLRRSGKQNVKHVDALLHNQLKSNMNTGIYASFHAALGLLKTTTILSELN